MEDTYTELLGQFGLMADVWQTRVCISKSVCLVSVDFEIKNHLVLIFYFMNSIQIFHHR